MLIPDEKSPIELTSKRLRNSEFAVLPAMETLRNRPHSIPRISHSNNWELHTPSYERFRVDTRGKLPCPREMRPLRQLDEFIQFPTSESNRSGSCSVFVWAHRFTMRPGID